MNKSIQPRALWSSSFPSLLMCVFMYCFHCASNSGKLESFYMESQVTMPVNLSNMMHVSSPGWMWAVENWTFFPFYKKLHGVGSIHFLVTEALFRKSRSEILTLWWLNTSWKQKYKSAILDPVLYRLCKNYIKALWLLCERGSQSLNMKVSLQIKFWN